MLSKSFFTPRVMGLPFSQKTRFTALNKINLTVKKGEVCGVLGRNGAGKTTLIKILTTLIRPTSGVGKVNHYDISTQDEKVRQSIGFISNDERSFYWRLSGIENLIFFAALQGMHGEKVKKQIGFLLNLLGLDKKKNLQVQKYSAGMKQRLSIARGLIHEPPVLFLDEPTKALDPFVSEEIRTFIRKELVEKRGITLFLATHDLTETIELCDTVALMHKGEVKAKLGPDELASEKKLKRIFIDQTKDDL